MAKDTLQPLYARLIWDTSQRTSMGITCVAAQRLTIAYAVYYRLRRLFRIARLLLARIQGFRTGSVISRATNSEAQHETCCPSGQVIVLRSEPVQDTGSRYPSHEKILSG